MNGVSVIIPLSIGVSGVIVWLLISKRKSSSAAATDLPSNLNETLPTARHFMYFPQIRQALSVADTKYLMENAPPGVAKRALRERRAVARRFLQGLHEDFSNLDRLGRIIAGLSPVVSRQQEMERLILSLKFQVLYALVWLRLSAGNLPLEQLDHLTELVGRFAKRMDVAMEEINALSAGPLPRGFRA